MIFTRRFGALAARRTFPHFDEMQQDQILDLPSAETETDAEQTDVQSAA